MLGIATVSALTVLAGCNNITDVSEVNGTLNEDTGKYSDVIEIAEFTKRQYDTYNFQTEMLITADNIETFEESSNITDVFSSDTHYYKSAIQDGDTVVIQENIVFQSAKGYIATKKNSLETYSKDNYKEPVFDVATAFGYDADTVSVIKKLGEYDDWNLYYFVAGL